MKMRGRPLGPAVCFRPADRSGCGPAAKGPLAWACLYPVSGWQQIPEALRDPQALPPRGTCLKSPLKMMTSAESFFLMKALIRGVWMVDEQSERNAGVALSRFYQESQIILNTRFCMFLPYSTGHRGAPPNPLAQWSTMWV